MACLNPNIHGKSVTFSFKRTDEEDVEKEKDRVKHLINANLKNKDALLAYSLTKIYDKKMVVNLISFGVHHQEIFGLLGVNGARMTTTFQMISGEIKPSLGESFIGNLSLRTAKREYLSKIGFCPQYNAEIANITGKELIYLFGRLRGVSEKNLPSEVAAIIKSIDLSECVNNFVVNYSGGNKRKLTLALALIGSPEILLLDEPTSGVDPAARRKMWTMIQGLKNSGSSVILTSHSMDECEFICNRIGIMVSGEFKCLGSTQRLLTKFGQGYDLIVKLKPGLSNKHEVIKIIETKLPDSNVIRENINEIHLDLSNKTIPRGQIAQLLEELKTNGTIDDYQISDKNLESVYLHFAQQYYNKHE